MKPLICSLWLSMGVGLWPMIAQAYQEDPKPTPQRDQQSLVMRVRPSLAVIRVADRDGVRSGVGSGFVIDSKGLIATNFHVIGESRTFTVELYPGKKYKVIGIEASDRNRDLAIIRIDPEGTELSPLPLAEEPATQGMGAVAFGNPLGLKHSVVQGIVSALREIEGQELIQLAMPIEPGNSGGPLMDEQGRVHGIVNMKSAIDQNLGFAIPVSQLKNLLRKPNPIAMDRWLRRSAIDSKRWETLFGSQWSQRSGQIHVSGAGDGFGGRSLCLLTELPQDAEFECHVQVRLDDEAGAAGLVFHADGADRHYGFYPSNGKVRLSCFRGPDVFAWEVLQEVPSPAYRPGEWNELAVRVHADSIQCFVNGSLAIESRDRTFRTGKVGLAKFRDTSAKFRRFEIHSLRDVPLTIANDPDLQTWIDSYAKSLRITDEQIQKLATQTPMDRIERLQRRATELQAHAKQLERMADDLQTNSTIQALQQSLREHPHSPLRSSLWIAKLDHPDIDVAYYVDRVQEMAKEVGEPKKNESSIDTLARLNRYLFEENGYHGSREEYYHAANCQMNRVIDDGEGMPIALSILYMALAQELQVAVDGIGLPGHFIARHRSDDGRDHWIDVYQQGKKLHEGELSTLVLANSNRPLQEEDLRPQSTLDISTRVLRNLMGSAERRGDAQAVLRYVEALVALYPEDPQYRMMRASLRHQTKRLALAVEDLDWLIDHAPSRLDPHDLIPLRESILRSIPDGQP